MKIGNGSNKLCLRNKLHWGPLKTVLGSGFEKTRKINGNIVGKIMIPKQYWKTNNFLDFWSFPTTMKKLCYREPRNSCFGVQNGGMGLPGSTYPLIFDVLVWCQKRMILNRPPAGPKNQKNLCILCFRMCLLWNRDYFWPAGPTGRHPFRAREAQGKETGKEDGWRKACWELGLSTRVP